MEMCGLLVCPDESECQLYFGFLLRYGPPVIGDREDNCLLTDYTLSNNININKDFAIDPECELYYRGSYGHGCEIGRYPEYSPIGNDVDTVNVIGVLTFLYISRTLSF